MRLKYTHTWKIYIYEIQVGLKQVKLNMMAIEAKIPKKEVEYTKSEVRDIKNYVWYHKEQYINYELKHELFLIKLKTNNITCEIIHTKIWMRKFKGWFKVILKVMTQLKKLYQEKNNWK